MRPGPIVIALGLLLSATALGPAFVEMAGAVAFDPRWGEPPTGTPVCTFPGDQQRPRLLSDGQGGAYVTWEEKYPGPSTLYLKRLDSAGIPVWKGDGVILASSNFELRWPQLVTDGQGGAIVLWQEENAGNSSIYAQRVTPSGSLPWGQAPRPVCTAPGSHRYCQAVADGLGGVIAAWQEGQTAYDIFAQRLNGTGVMQWNAAGVPVCAQLHYQSHLKLASDENGGAIIAWQDERDSRRDVYAQRLDAAGSVQWTDNGTQIAEKGACPQVVSDGKGGAFIVWQDNRNGTWTDIYAQRVDPNGAFFWNSSGVVVSNASHTQEFYDDYYDGTEISYPVVPDGSGGAIAVYKDSSLTGEVFSLSAQRVAPDGSMLWKDNGVPLGIATASNAVAVADGAGGVIVVGYDPPYRYDVGAQRLDLDGNRKWGDAGIVVLHRTDMENWPDAVSDGRGNAIFAFTFPNISTRGDIYATRVGMRIMPAAPLAAVEDAPFRYDFESNDNANTTWSIETVADWIVINSSTGTLSGTPDNSDVGSWDVSVKADDGGSYDLLDFILKVVNVPPSPTNFPLNLSLLEDSRFRFDLNSTDEGAGSSFYILTFAPGWLSVDPLTGILSGMPSNSDVGDHLANITFNDGHGGLANGSILLIVHNVNDAPFWLILPEDSELSEGENFTAVALAGDPDRGDAVAYSISSEPPSGVQVEPASGIIQWTNTTAGRYRLDLTASDGRARLSHQFDLSIIRKEPPIPPNHPPVLEPVAVRKAVAGRELRIQLSATDEDSGDFGRLRFRLIDGPQGAVLSENGTLLWLPGNADAGPRLFNVSVTDGKDTASGGFQVTVSRAPSVEDGPATGPLYVLIALLAVLALALPAIVYLAMCWKGQRGVPPVAYPAPQAEPFTGPPLPYPPAQPQVPPPEP